MWHYCEGKGVVRVEPSCSRDKVWQMTEIWNPNQFGFLPFIKCWGGGTCACYRRTNGAQRCAEELTNERRSRCVIRDWRHRGGCVVHNTLTVWAPRTHSHTRARAQPLSLCHLWWVTYSCLRRLTVWTSVLPFYFTDISSWVLCRGVSESSKHGGPSPTPPEMQRQNFNFKKQTQELLMWACSANHTSKITQRRNTLKITTTIRISKQIIKW